MIRKKKKTNYAILTFVIKTILTLVFSYPYYPYFCILKLRTKAKSKNKERSKNPYFCILKLRTKAREDKSKSKNCFTRTGINKYKNKN